MRLGFDTSILRHAPHAGTARYARELLPRMTDAQPPGWQVIAVAGWPRWRPEQDWARGARRAVNLAIDVGWLAGGALAAAASARLDAWFGPANSLPWLMPRPGIVTIHDTNVLSAPTTYDRAFVRYATATMRMTVRRARRIVTDSRASRDQLIGWLDVDPAKVRSVYPGADHLAMIEPAASDLGLPRPYALFVGQTEPHKNVGVLIDAWRAGVDARLHLVIGGPPGRDDERLRQAVGRSGLGNRVHFTGLLDERNLARLYSDAHLFLLPSLAEGFGFPPLEAMARGIPTAVSSIASLVEVTRDGALRFDPRDPAGIAHLVNEMSDDPQLRERLSSAGRRVASAYRWTATAAEIWEEVRHAVEH